MIRVLHYGMSPNLGGIETYLLNLATTLDPDEVHSDFLYSEYGQQPIYAPELPDSRFFGVTPRRVSPRRNRRDLDRLFASEDFDILHFHANTASYVEPVKAALRHGVHVVYHSHNAGASRSRLTQVLHAWHRSTLPWKRIARVAVSQDAGRWMFGDQLFDVIHNGIDIDAFKFDPLARQHLRETWAAGPDTLVVGQVAAFLPAKNHSFTLAVFAEVVRQRPDSLLVLVGAGPDEDAVKERAGAAGLDDRVLFLGRRSDVAGVMSGMDILLLPSLHEGFGLVAVEAQASGLPCLLSDGVPPDAQVTPLCLRLALAEPASTWAGRLLGLRSDDRSKGTDLVRAAGFSVAANTASVADVYRRVTRGRGA